MISKTNMIKQEKAKFRRNIWKMYIFQFLISLHFFGAVLVPFFTDFGHLNFFQIMLLQSWFAFWVFLLEVPTGAIADFLGRKTSLMIGALVNILAVIIYSSSANFLVFMLGEFLFALACALFSGADEALVYDSLKKVNQENRSKKVLGKIESYSLAGIMIGAPIGSLIASQFGVRAPMLLMAIPLTVAFFISLTFHEPKNGKRESRRYLDIVKDSFALLKNSKVLKILAVDLTVIATIGYFMIWFYQPMLKQANIPIGYFGLVHAGLVIVELLIMNNYGKLEKLFGSKKGLIFFSAAITGLMFIIAGLTKSIPLVIISILLGGGFSLSRGPLFSSYMNKYIPSSKRATVMSSINMFRRFLVAILNPFVGLLVDWNLSYTLIILGAIALVFTLCSRVEEKHLKD